MILCSIFEHGIPYKTSLWVRTLSNRQMKTNFKANKIKMRFITTLLLSVLGGITIASPLPGVPDPPNFFYKPLTLTFHGGPASYSLSLAADGNSYNTNNGMAVSLISSPDFDAFHFCNFYTTGQKAIVPSPSNNQLAIGPPQPIVSVDCEPTPGGNGTCLPAYGKSPCDFVTWV